MATLQSIGFTLVGGGCLGAISFAFFGWAVWSQTSYIAPRATARPATVIHNPDAKPGDAQYRGNPITGWIPWTLSLTYDTLLRGVPGTGTRQGGRQGSLLQVNLDGIVLLRFHSLGLRVAGMATLLCIGILLPVYFTAACYDHPDWKGCAAPGGGGDNETVPTLTNYDRTTIANVPADVYDGGPGSIVKNQIAAVRARLYTTVFCFWILVGYTCWQLRREWVEILAMRRVYYLEANIWGNRREELQRTLLYKENQARQSQKNSKQHHPQRKTSDDYDNGEEHLIHRDPWIPHPEPRDTVPNIQLYSLLVGGLPSLPDNNFIGATFSKRQSVDWQLQLTATFFDHCVPNQPGFSSSVAAVTIVPSARALAVAWRKWYAAAAKLRRLRFIREIMAERRHYAIESGSSRSSSYDSEEEDDDDDVRDLEQGRQTQATQAWPTAYLDDKTQGFTSGDMPQYNDRTAPPPIPSPLPIANNNDDAPVIYERMQRHQSYYRAVLGGVLDETTDTTDGTSPSAASVFGPEQAAVYSREFAQAAAPCCPRGCWEERIRRASIDELEELEAQVAAEVHEANMALKAARQKATLVEDDEEEDPEQAESEVSLPHDPSNRSLGSASTPKRWQQSLSFEGTNIPSGLKLEAQLYEKSKDREVSKPELVRSHTSGSAVKTPNKSKHHRRSVSLEGANLPSDLLLEAQLYEKGPKNSNRRTTEHTKESFLPLESLPHLSEEEDDLLFLDEIPTVPSQAWEHVQALVKESADHTSSTRSQSRRHYLANGQWDFPSVQSLLGRTRKHVKIAKTWTKSKPLEAVENLSRNSTYAVVTFTSRQAAVAARHTLTDGRGVDRWNTLRELPIPPLADAAACDLLACRNCCRPLALGVNERQKNARYYITQVALATIYTLYTVPLNLASKLVTPDELDSVFPQLAEWSENLGFEVTGLLSGFATALIWSTFFAICPVIFKALANFGSKASSVASAEFRALQYYWWFMVLTAFSGQILAEMVWRAFTENNAIGSEVQTILRTVATTIPSEVAVNWLNWIIFRQLAVLPYQYMLQVNTFLFSLFGLKCCSRVVRGGGPGGPTPYRIYVDSGVVLMCAVSLAPSSPLVAPAAFSYFLYCQPLLRRNLIFMYRPKYDGGGLRWPFVFDMCISSMVMGSLLLAAQMGLKEGAQPAVLAGLTLVPIILFQRGSKRKYLRAFKDASLLQTSLLDGWNTEDSSIKSREELRRFLVDAHKAAYVPVCLAATDTDDYLTIEPALVVPLDSDSDKNDSFIEDSDGDDNEHGAQKSHGSLLSSAGSSGVASIPAASTGRPPNLLNRRQSQRGAMVRRSVNLMSTADRRATICKLQSLRTLPVREDDYAIQSPFEGSRRCSHGRSGSSRFLSSGTTKTE